MSFFVLIPAGVSFFDLAMALLVVGLVERALYLLPADMVGDGGWLLDTGPEV